MRHQSYRIFEQEDGTLQSPPKWEPILPVKPAITNGEHSKVSGLTATLHNAESGALFGSGVRGDRAARNCQFWRVARFGIHPETGSVRAVSALAAAT
jgi:hypothetical protein